MPEHDNNQVSDEEDFDAASVQNQNTTAPEAGQSGSGRTATASRPSISGKEADPESIRQDLHSISDASKELRTNSGPMLANFQNDSNLPFEASFQPFLDHFYDEKAKKPGIEERISKIPWLKRRSISKEFKETISEAEKAEKKAKETQKTANTIKSNNQKVLNSKKEFNDQTNSVKALLNSYEKQAAKYTADGQNYPDEHSLGSAKTSLDTNSHSLEILQKFSKEGALVSKNILSPSEIPLLKTRQDALWVHYNMVKEQLLPQMKAYLASNTLFDQEFPTYNEPLLKASENYANFLNPVQEASDKNKRYAETRKKEYFETAQKSRQALSKQSKNLNRFLTNFSSRNSKYGASLSKKKAEQLNDFTKKLNLFTGTAADAATSDRFYLAVDSGNFHQTTKQELSSELATYLQSDQKRSYEEYPEKIKKIEDTHQNFTTSSMKASAQIAAALADPKLSEAQRQQLTELEHATKENTDTIDNNYSKFLKKHERMQRAHETIQRFNVKGKKAPTLMRLVRHVKEVEDGTFHENLTLLQRLEKNVIGAAEDWVGDKIDKVNKATKGSAGAAGSIVWETASALSDSYDAYDSYTDKSEQTSYMQFNKLDNVPNGLVFGMKIISVIKSGYGTFKELIALINEWHSGSDKREFGKRFLSLCASLNETFGGVLGFFEEKIPIIGTIQKALSIVTNAIDWYRSSKSKSSMDDKKERLKKRIEEKNKQYQEEFNSDPKHAIATDVYNINSDENIASAKTYGFYRRQKTASRAYAKTDELAGRMLAIKAREAQQNASQTSAASGQNAAQASAASGQNAAQAPAAQTRTQDHLLLNEAGTQSIATQRHDLLLEKQRLKQANEYTGKNKARLKEKSRTLKALQDMNELSIASEAKKRMRNKIHGDIESIIKDGLSIIGDFAEYFGAGPGAIVQLAISLGNAVEGLAHSTISKVRQTWRDNHNSFYSTENKKKRRNQMAETMYDRLHVLSKQLNNDGTISTDSMSDALYLETGEHFENLEEDLVLGLDAYITHILNAGSKEDMIESMGSAFSVDGN